MAVDRAAIFFDVDGVLIDSLPAHLALCRDKAVEYGLPLEIPSESQFRCLVSQGKSISPMLDFFKTVGFSAPHAARAVRDYESEFARRYHPPLFENVPRMLRRLNSLGYTLGIVTSNTSENVLPILGETTAFFDDRCVFTLDRFPDKRPKAWCLTEGAHILRKRPHDCFYVGDLPSDAKAAAEAGFRFLGVTFGWGIRTDDQTVERVDTVMGIIDAVETSAYTFLT